MIFELVKDVALDGVKSELARHDRGDEKKIIFTNLGFANLPNQIYRKSVKDGFEFNLMVCGSSGLGKSTLMNSLFLTDIYSAVSTYNHLFIDISKVGYVFMVNKNTIGSKQCSGISRSITTSEENFESRKTIRRFERKRNSIEPHSH